MTKISKENLRSIQEIQTEILSIYHSICTENSLPYLIYAGTMLGQVRHGGFIPWDDDIDVAMKRADYLALIGLRKEFEKNNLFLQHKTTDCEFPHHFIRIRANDTLMIQKEFIDIDMHHGVFIDVFPLDYLPNEKYFLRNLYFSFSLLLHNKIRILLSIVPRTKTKLIIKNILLLAPSELYLSRAEKNRMRFNNKRSKSPWLASLTLSVDKKNISKFKIHEKEFNNRNIVMFEGIEVMSSMDDVEILTRRFGDYNKLPPKEEQRPHHGIVEFKDMR